MRSILLILAQLLCSAFLVSAQIHFRQDPNQGHNPGGVGINFNFPTDQLTPGERKSTEVGCNCQSNCGPGLGQLQHGCIDPNGNSRNAICCINQEGVIVTRFGANDPSSVGAVSVSDSSTSRSLAAGRDGLNQILQDNQRRLSAGQFVPRLTPAAGHAKFYYRDPSWIENNNIAYQIALATQDIAQRENLTPAQAQFGLTQTRTQPLVGGLRCPTTEPIRCGRVEQRFRTIDGTCNNLARPDLGRSESRFGRLAPAIYDDGIMSPRTTSVLGGPLPNAREISSRVLIDKDSPSSKFTLNLMQWAQFMDHDLTHAPVPDMNGQTIECCKNGQLAVPQPKQCFTILVSQNDGFYNKQSPPQNCINFVRSMFGVPPGCQLGPAEQLNVLTHWIDGSMVYGSIENEFFRVRDPNSPELRVTPSRKRDLLPTNASIDCEARVPGTLCNVAGDSRVNEQPALTVMHTLLVREHNRIVRALGHRVGNPEELFQLARKIVIAQIQHITYFEWLPLIIGPKAYRRFNLAPKTGKAFNNLYNSAEDPTMSSEFATAVFRFGHSLITGFFKLFKSNGRQSFKQLRDSFNDPSIIQNDPSIVDQFVLGLTTQESQNLENFITRDVSNHLFQTPNFNFGMDLMALNIQRGRDHAISTYNTMRERFSGFGRARDFKDLDKSTHDKKNIIALQSVYSHVDDIDLFTGGMTENSVNGGLLGPTFANIVAEQFQRTRDADRFFHEFPEQFTPEQLNEIRKTSMARIMCDNSDVPSMQPNAFLSHKERGNDKTSCDLTERIPRMDLNVFLPRRQSG